MAQDEQIEEWQNNENVLQRYCGHAWSEKGAVSEPAWGRELNRVQIKVREGGFRFMEWLQAEGSD